MNPLVIRVRSSVSWLVFCVLPLSGVLYQQQSSAENFKPLWEELLMRIEPKSFWQVQERPKEKRHFGRTTVALGRISGNGIALHGHKLPLYKSKRPIESGLIEANTEKLKLSLKYISSLNRFEPYMKGQARQYLLDTFQSYGLKGIMQNFKAPYIENQGVNIIGIRAGSVRSRYDHHRSGGVHRWPANDRVLVIGAHYDVVANTSGLNDNSSGIAVMLEIMRLLSYFLCETKFTLIFVAFDLEELGAIGSKYFVHDYLIPNELDSAKYGSQYKGAIIMDTLLNFDTQPGTQDIPNDIRQNVPQFSADIKHNNYSGDFLAMFARSSVDLQLSKLIEQKWKHHDLKYSPDWQRYRLRPVQIESLSRDKVTSYDDLQQHVNMLRSDHLNFWYHNHSSHPSSLSAVLLTDTGPFRGYMRYCYHKTCDDSRFLTQSNVNFVKKTVDVLLQVILQITEGRCFFEGNSNQ